MGIQKYENDIVIDPDEQVYPLAVAAKLLQIHPRTIRLYEKNGLLLRRKKNSIRLFSKNELNWIKCIRDMIHKDKISINGIKKLLEIIPCWEIRNCKPSVKNVCPAYINMEKNCWEMQNTSCSKHKKTCKACPVFIQRTKKKKD